MTTRGCVSVSSTNVREWADRGMLYGESVSTGLQRRSASTALSDTDGLRGSHPHQHQRAVIAPEIPGMPKRLYRFRVLYGEWYSLMYVVTR